MTTFPTSTDWKQCENCGEYIPVSQLLLNTETGKYLCDVCTYEYYMRRTSSCGQSTSTSAQ